MIFPNNSGVGELPWDLHAVSADAEIELLGLDDPPPAAWFNSPKFPDDLLIRRLAIPLLASIHLLGSGVANVSEAWMYRETGLRPEITPLRLRLFARGEEFYLPAGTDEATLTTVHEKISLALTTAPWLRITLEHMLLALDRSGLSDGLLDMTICLESLIRASTEVAFRFSHQIPPLVTDSPSELEDFQRLLEILYDLRSQHVHGTMSGKKALQKEGIVEDRWEDIQRIMRAAVIYAIEFHSHDNDGDWKSHLNQRMHSIIPAIQAKWGTVQ